MKRVYYVNKFYLAFTIIIISFFLIRNIIIFLKSYSAMAVLPITIEIAILFLMLLRHKYLRIAIIVWSFLFIISGGLLLLSQFIFLFTSVERFDIHNVIKDVVFLFIGLIMYFFLDKSIKLIEFP